ncbi:MAG: hypothetical protein WD627_13365 [Actinomycetota bacterium]
MLKTNKMTLQELKAQIANRITDYSIPSGQGSAGTLEISLANGAARTFRSHWTGFRITYSKPIILLKATLTDGSFWSEGYISLDQPSWVLAFRKEPHKSRGTGAERPDDKFAGQQSIETSKAIRTSQVEAGLVADEEIIRYEDFDSPQEAIDEFFNYTAFYCLRSVNVEWPQMGFVVDASIDWENIEAGSGPEAPPAALVDEALRKSDILWITVDTDPVRKPVPCWFLYTRDKKLFVLSGEPEQRIPYAAQARKAHVVVRWKGRDAQMVEFDAGIRPITAADKQEFEEVGHLLVAKRQSVRAGAADLIASWMRDGVILELTPKV